MAQVVESPIVRGWSRAASLALYAAFAVPTGAFFAGYFYAQPDPGEIGLPAIVPTNADDAAMLGFAILGMLILSAVGSLIPWWLTKLVVRRPPDLIVRAFFGCRPLDAIKIFATAWLVTYIVGYAIGHANVGDDGCIARMIF